MPASFNKIGHVDVEDLKESLVGQPELFGLYNHRALEGSPHAQMTDIWVRFRDIQPYLDGKPMNDFVDEHKSMWYPVVKAIPEVMPIISKVVSMVDGKRLGGVLITKLPPCGKILPHVDGGWHADYYDKYFVPIQNAKGAVFGFEAGEIAPDEGDVWGFDNHYSHWVNNDSEIDRIALVICVKQSKFDRAGRLL